MILQAALAAAAARLEAADVPEAARDARVLLAHVLRTDRGLLSVRGELVLDAEQLTAFEAAVTQRAARQPVSQIIGWREFYGRRFRITPDVLDPRPDTETLIDMALERPFRKVLDLGTGSGCILLTLLAERGGDGLGVDLSDAALDVARDNAAQLMLRAEFAVSDWFSGVTGQFDLIVSNPPYIAEAEMPTLAPEVRDHEPRMALTPGGDGLAAYRTIVMAAGRHLTPGGRLIVEIGPTQAAAVTELMLSAGLTGIQVRRDLDGRDRAVAAFTNSQQSE